ncbi:hypothetical protein EXIGUO8H_370003 [Exiguobacterium sp. 8H]|uniref:hypothetical protein n=1 Tax=unclassified Exiguobacterium TaxID=2644629 RepID=UPI0012EF9CAF|nr:MULTISPECIES: hypothetical protein [unclassified Exiguobacterium]VXB83561.1 hypothetical protein EXIGUO8H_370003 [Exiguobacterium sp. 8H]VXB93054.1 hypothetical protein EXIGUO8A_260015 [Exiguobacterium sp. 8A]
MTWKENSKHEQLTGNVLLYLSPNNYHAFYGAEIDALAHTTRALDSNERVPYWK